MTTQTQLVLPERFVRLALVMLIPERGGIEARSQQPKMVKALPALAIVLFLGALVLALSGFAPKVQAGEVVVATKEVAVATNEVAVAAKADRLDAREASCSTQVWPDFTTSCLRRPGSSAKILQARVVTGRR